MKKVLLAILSLTIILGSFLFVDFVISNHNNKELYKNFESICYGATPESVREKMGHPKTAISPMKSLNTFWGYNKLHEDKIGKINKCYTYEMSSVLIRILNMSPQIMQIGFDENGKAVAKHYY